MVNLAQELIDAILDAVAGTQKIQNRLEADKNLRSCALVARNFVAPAQRHLFYYVHLEPDQIQRLATTLTTAPHLVAYIRHLDLELPMPEPLALRTISGLLTKVEHLGLYGPQGTRLRKIREEFWTVFSSMLPLQSLRSLKVASCGTVPASFVRHALSSYEEVALINIYLTDNWDIQIPSRPAGQTGTYLQRLVVEYRWSDDDDRALSNVVLEAELQHIRYLGLASPNTGVLLGFTQIALASRSIEHLDILGHLEGTEDVDVFDLPHLPGLRFLTLRQYIHHLNIGDDVITLLATAPDRTPNLEVVTVIILALEPWNAELNPELDCRDADRALRTLPHLREVHFKIYSECNQVVEFIEDVRQKLLPEANAAGRLVFTSILWDHRSTMELFNYDFVR